MKTLRERFEAKVNRGPNCWEWTAFRSSAGYGKIRVGGAGSRCALAHRVSYELYVGDIPNALEVCHKCDNPACVRPDHLFVGTHRENFADAVRKGRSPKGEKHPKCRLKRADVLSIYRLRNERAAAVPDIAAQFGVSQQHVYDIATGKKWAWLTGESH